MPEVPPVVRIFVPTYRRHTLLRRALHSLQNQSYRDWICEVHNDDPEDLRPGVIVEQLQDARFKLVQHQSNIGGTAMFNLIFRSAREPFYSLLEDDNWWEPEFLSTMLAAARQFPDCDIFWANQKIWEEQEDGSFCDTGKFVRDTSFAAGVQSFAWPQPSHITGALHSNSAMLIRSRSDTDYQTPEDTPLSAVEGFRDRTWRYPITFVPSPIANWSATRRTYRSKGRAEDSMVEVMLAATFLKYQSLGDTEAIKLWNEARKSKPPTTSVLLYASLVEPECRHLIQQAYVSDWGRLLRTALRHPSVPWTVLRSRRTRKGLWGWLDNCTAARFAEANAKDARTAVVAPNEKA